MKSLSDILNIFSKPLDNTFWKNALLVEEAALELGIDKVLDELNIREGKNKVLAVYLFGSLAELQFKESYKRPPRDLDLYFWVDSVPDTYLIARIKVSVKENCSAFGLNAHAVVSYVHPLANEDMKICEIYCLYIHPDADLRIRKEFS